MILDIVNVLLVEDDDQVAELIKITLDEKPYPDWKIKYKIQRVTTLKQALRYVAGGLWDIIILDIGLPNGQGLEVFTQVHAVAKAPIFVFTGTDDYGTIQEMKQLGAMRCYTKTRLMRCMSIIHDIIDNVRLEWQQRRSIENLEAARYNALRDLERACAVCGKWQDPVSGDWLKPADFLERRGIFLTHGLCADDMQDKYGHLLDEDKNV